MSINISKEKRQILYSKINVIKEYLKKNIEDENAKKLLSFLGDIENEVNSKKYGLVFEEHREKIDELLEENLPVLTEEKDLFIDNGGQINFLLEGDNLAALQLLEKTHKGKIDVILIDPPYNTGDEDFIYDDKYVDKEDLFVHSKWLSFMEKRLKSGWKILNTNGVMFIHIDDNEQSNLKLLCDSICGKENFVNAISIKMSEPTGVKMTHASKRLPKLKEYILVYKKSEIKIRKITIPKEKWDSEYKILIKNISQEELEIIKETIYSDNPTEKDIEKLDDIVKNVEFSNVSDLFEPNMSEKQKNEILYKNSWRILRDVATTGTAKILADEKKNKSGNAFFILTPKKKIYFIKNGYNNNSVQPRIKLLFADNYLTVSPGDFWQDIKTTGLADEGNVIFLKGKKPLKSEMRLLELYPSKNSTILDFFAGSGTTGHAVLKLNAEDGGNRKFILCTNNENRICKEITYQRIKNVLTKDNLPGSLKYFKIDFIPIKEKEYYEYADKLLLHVRELVELENAVNFTENKKLVIILTEEELEDLLQKINQTENSLETLYLGHDVLLSSEQKHLLQKLQIQIKIIPQYYYPELQG